MPGKYSTITLYPRVLCARFYTMHIPVPFQQHPCSRPYISDPYKTGFFCINYVKVTKCSISKTSFNMPSAGNAILRVLFDQVYFLVKYTPTYLFNKYVLQVFHFLYYVTVSFIDKLPLAYKALFSPNLP